MQNYFHNFLKRIAIDEIDLGEQITSWKECLDQSICVEFVRKSGSTKRGTNLYLSDVDIIVIFEKGFDKSIPELFLATTEGNIRSCFGKVKEMDHGFRYEGLKSTTVDITVGYSHRSYPLVYWVPDKRNDRFVWIETSPDASEKRIEDANRLTSGKAGNYVRLMKFWNIFRQRVFNSFYLEVLVIRKILPESEKFNNFTYPEGLAYLFEYLITAVDQKIPQDSKRGPHIGDISENERQRIKDALNYSTRMAKLALDPECNSNNQRIYWENIFGYELTK